MLLNILKDAVVTSYGKKGEKIVNMNNAAIDKGVESIVEINVPEAWKTVADEEAVEIKHVTRFVKRYSYSNEQTRRRLTSSFSICRNGRWYI